MVEKFSGTSRTRPGRVAALAAVVLLLVTGTSLAQTSTFEVGVRANVLLGHGKPANDILGAGIIGRYMLADGWFIGAAIDRYQYDFERPARVVGIRQDPDEDVIDADGENTVVSGSFGRLYNPTDRGFDWFWTVGIGLVSASVDDVAGPTDSGGAFDLAFDVGDEVHLMATVGASYNFSKNWSASFAARAEHHFMDIRIEDRVSGATAKIDSQSPLGVYVSLNYRF